LRKSDHGITLFQSLLPRLFLYGIGRSHIGGDVVCLSRLRVRDRTIPFPKRGVVDHGRPFARSLHHSGRESFMRGIWVRTDLAVGKARSDHREPPAITA